jgi:hypothetical protein
MLRRGEGEEKEKRRLLTSPLLPLPLFSSSSTMMK